ncbi:NAD(+) synthase [Rudaeicoccus suwonensis]|uniref:Glutamine-dependent NAD(+) synthetase n=1 Tax=Rudaeicoccus suwonensis TaxID=657409 RepID=A0A561E3H9_9MICO|nr:NAD(+) synthase [Rudaeicoccus suwonensis]TWE10173.1 NAD+ synthase (glutamine-hydrolysing) [Rudaeicoccus suwonensis]
MEFLSAYDQGFARIAACTVPTAIADPTANAAVLIEQIRACHADSVAVAVFPEMALTGYAIDDLVMQDVILDATETALGEIAAATTDLLPMVLVGAPLRNGLRVFNCAVVIHRGEIIGVAPKSYLPNYREFYDKRYFAPGDDQVGGSITLDGKRIPFGPDLIFRATDVPGLAVHAEVCEDMWVPIPPSSLAALAGATVQANLSGSPITVGRAADRQTLVQGQSARCLSAYVYAASGQGESTTDLSWDGMTMIYECGGLLGRTERFPDAARRTVVDVDLDRLRQERQRDGSIADNARTYVDRIAFRTIDVTLQPPRTDIGLRRKLQRFPFVPDHPERLAQDCYEAYNIQVTGLVQRLRAIGQPKVVIGISGGLDSTHALLIAAQAMDRLGRPRTDILAYTMPGFATGNASKDNAIALMREMGVTAEELDIRPTATQMLKDMGHPAGFGEPVYDITFENVQAGLRYDYLFRLANQRGGIVLGTGDLSELALGWCTYGVGDQMSHYNVNAGIPKTLIQHLIRWVIDSGLFEAEATGILQSIVDAEISPELIPTTQGEAPQSTEASIGPYALQDFTLFHVLRHGMRPSRIAFLAMHAWGDVDHGDWPAGYPEGKRRAYDLSEIARWLEVFLRRFFAFSQFKRSALPNGPKVVSGGALSPRGDWRAPSDGNAEAWIAELKASQKPTDQ